MNELSALISEIVSSAPLLIIAALFGLDSIRAVLASLGIVNPDTKFGRIIYGKRDKMIISSALRDLGYSSETTAEIVLKLKSVSKSADMANAGVKAEDAAIQLIIMLSKYIFEFNDMIVYGGKSLTRSKYYIDTMEISHNEEDKQKLAAIMIHLLYLTGSSKNAPQTIITPKGGNPLFAQAVAATLNSHLIVAKALTDKSRIRIADKSNYSQEQFLVNYEGSWFLSKAQEKKSCVVIDCNTSGGSQLLDIVKDIRMYTDKTKDSLMISIPSDVFVLFRADIDGDNIDAKFSEHKCELHRFFDLDETAKAKMYKLRASRKERGMVPSYYSDEDKDEAQEIISYLERKGLYYYNDKRKKEKESCCRRRKTAHRRAKIHFGKP